jgi:Predicted xylanase/chitin deacetylase
MNIPDMHSRNLYFSDLSISKYATMESTMKERVKKQQDCKTSVLLISVIVLLSLTCIFFICFLLNRQTVVIDLNGDETEDIEYGQTYQEKGAVAHVKNSTLFFLHPAVDVSVSSNINDKKLGTYTVTYTAVYQNIEETKDRTVIIHDTTPPVITLVTNADSYTPYNHPYTEEGYQAVDACDGDLTAKVKSEEKDGTVNYTVTDSSGNTATASRKIKYDDRVGPAINLGGGDVTVYVGDSYADSYSAVDDCDGDVTAKIAVSGTVDTNTVGIYTITYTVSDSHGNQSTAQRTVTVKVRPVNVITNENSKTIYLTYDDGPGPYTAQLLDILDKYQVKATFFTTSSRPAYADMIGQEAVHGHTVAVHTYTHNYASVYASTDAYWADFNAQNAVVAQKTGSYSTMFRFPGGSSNTVSRNYCSGIMTALTSQAGSMGYTYFDWNVSSGDAGEATNTNDVYQNVISQVSANTRAGLPSVVLQHDIKGFSVNAVESIIIWGLENGYSFQALSPGSYHAHQRIAN